jgi:hypothetical protein
VKAAASSVVVGSLVAVVAAVAATAAAVVAAVTAAVVAATVVDVAMAAETSGAAVKTPARFYRA